MTQAMSQKCIHWKTWVAESSQPRFSGFWRNLRYFHFLFCLIHLVAVFSRVALTLPANAVATVVAQCGSRVVWPAFNALRRFLCEHEREAS